MIIISLWITLLIIFLIERLIIWNSENTEKWRHKFSEPEVTPSQCLFCPTNSPNLNIIKNELK